MCPPAFAHIGESELSAATKAELREITDDFFERPLEKAGAFDWDAFKQNEAFKAIMMPSKLFWVLGSFERSFTQKLGQQMYEQFGKAVANANPDIGTATTQHKLTDLTLTPTQQQRIEHILDDLDDGTRTPDWNTESSHVTDTDATSGTPSEAVGQIIWDLWIDDYEDGRPLACEIKSPKPNKDQSIASKRQMLKTVAAYEHRDEPTPIVRYVFPFNPFGTLEEYTHWPAKAVFDVEHEDGMLVADRFWNGIGGPDTMEGLYNFLLEESENNIEKLTSMAEDAGSDTDDALEEEWHNQTD